MWTTVGEIGDVVTGNTPSKDNLDFYGGNIPFFKPTDLEQGVDTKFSNDRLSLLGYEASRKLPANTVLVTCIGATIGKTGLISVEGSCNQQINAIIPTKSVVPYFLYYTCVSEYMQNEIKNNASATTLPILNKGNFSKIAFPLPPLEEQKRIVFEIERWLSFVDVVERGKSDLQTTISQAKSKILDLAIHGKLVPQDPNDEPASELLKRINPKAEITCDTPQYGKLPKGWCKTTLGNTIVIKSGDAIKVRDNRIGKYPIYGGNGITGYNESYNVDGINIIIGRVGFYCGSVHYVNNKVWVTDNAFVTKINGNVYTPKFLYYLLLQYDLKQYSNSTAQPVISGKTVYSINVMLPPLSEQHRIVARIEELFAQLDKIESPL